MDGGAREVYGWFFGEYGTLVRTRFCWGSSVLGRRCGQEGAVGKGYFDERWSSNANEAKVSRARGLGVDEGALLLGEMRRMRRFLPRPAGPHKAQKGPSMVVSSSRMERNGVWRSCSAGAEAKRWQTGPVSR